MKSVNLKFFLIAALASCDLVNAGNLRSMPAVNIHDVEQHMVGALTGTSSKDIQEGSERLERLEKQLRPTYDALPKNEHGNLNHASVRYVLHRFFMQRFTWYVRGLEPGDDAAAHADAYDNANLNFTLGSAPEWLSFLQGDMEKVVGHKGLTLRGVASLAAAIEELVHHDARNRLTMAYDGRDIKTDSVLSANSALMVLKEYMLLYTSGWNMTEMSHEQLKMEERKHFNSHRWQEMFMPWLETLQTDVTKKRGFEADSMNFDAVASIAEEVGKRFLELNNQDCGSLKQTLLDMEDRTPGRVRLSDFYNKSRFSKFAFTEKIDYLRTLGALDESDTSNPRVIITNYVTSMPQCLKASTLYTVCCPNQCEALMGSLENAIAEPEAEPDRIARLVADLSTETVVGPRELPETLLNRLTEIAKLNNGKVPLHGRLFAQWLHHAFPRECPYPHEVSTTSPLTPDEWMQKHGHASSDASEEEMMDHIRADPTCPIEGCGEDHVAAELPWTPTEEFVHARELPGFMKLKFEGVGGGVDSGESEMSTLLEGVDETSASPSSSGWFSTAFVVLAGLVALGVAAAVRSHLFTTMTAGRGKKGYEIPMWN
jgi:hypothetical protein